MWGYASVDDVDSFIEVEVFSTTDLSLVSTQRAIIKSGKCSFYYSFCSWIMTSCYQHINLPDHKMEACDSLQSTNPGEYKRWMFGSVDITARFVTLPSVLSAVCIAPK